MPHFRISEAAGLLGVSDDTVRRWIETGSLPVRRDASNVKVVDGVALAESGDQVDQRGRRVPG